MREGYYLQTQSCSKMLHPRPAIIYRQTFDQVGGMWKFERVSRVQSGFSHIKPSILSLKWNKVMYTHMKALRLEDKHKRQCMKPKASCLLQQYTSNATIFTVNVSLWLISMCFSMADVNGNIYRAVWQI